MDFSLKSPVMDKIFSQSYDEFIDHSLNKHGFNQVDSLTACIMEGRFSITMYSRLPYASSQFINIRWMVESKVSCVFTWTSIFPITLACDIVYLLNGIKIGELGGEWQWKNGCHLFCSNNIKFRSSNKRYVCYFIILLTVISLASKLPELNSPWFKDS